MKLESSRDASKSRARDEHASVMGVLFAALLTTKNRAMFMNFMEVEDKGTSVHTTYLSLHGCGSIGFRFHATDQD